MTRTKPLLAIGILFLALVACATPSPQLSGDGGPIDVSISEIHKDPRAWHGKLVRVSGTFDECISYTCQFCETEEALIALNAYYKEWFASGDRSGNAAERMCMGVSFYSKHYPPEDEGNRAFLESTLTLSSNESEKFARFTTSTIIATYDSSCSNFPREENFDTIVLCTDRASELRNAKLFKTHIQRPATAGVTNQYGIEPLGTLDLETKNAISAAFQKTRSVASDKKGLPDFIFLLQKQEWYSDYRVSAEGGACECVTDECAEEDWPKREGDTWIETPSNPYVCWQAELVDGIWRFPLQ